MGRPVFVRGLCLCVACVCAWPVFVRGLCLCVACVCAWPVFVRGLCLCVACVCAWPVFVRGLCLSNEEKMRKAAFYVSQLNCFHSFHCRLHFIFCSH